MHVFYSFMLNIASSTFHGYVSPPMTMTTCDTSAIRLDNHAEIVNGKCQLTCLILYIHFTIN